MIPKIELNNSHILVTGTSSGLGRAVAESLLIAGAKVSGCSRRNINFSNQSFNHLKVDVSKIDELRKSLKDSVSKYGKISAVVHCAGVYGPFESIENVNEKDWYEAISINLFGTFNILKLTPSLFESNGGPIICLSGGGATSAMPNISSYGASKAAVVRLVETAAEELSPKNISVYALAPGLMATEMLDQILNSSPSIVGENFYDKMVEFKSSGRDHTKVAVDLILSLIKEPLPELNGRLLSAAWDPWKKWFTNESAVVFNKDDYMLRRIIPK